ncbi:MFS transporter [Aurantimonas marianensis]|uniref:MFS transporter n=1 Tax=Aurantimonas marianensis TaxID=2920428 RepID=A0A9X2H4Q9_9HYPH|nr:MFS transporter [Aurantimonas marianensis]MCP3055252.1 MFS transporter [Aurantimonas marianensis]
MTGVVILAVTYILSQFFRSFLAVLAPQLTRDLGIGEAALSSAAGLWFIAFALMQFPVGFALDRYGPRRTVALFLLAAAGGSLLFALAKGATAIIVAMTLIGAGCAPILMAAFFIFARTFPPRRFAMFASLFLAFGLGGGVLGSAPLALAVDAVGWRQVMAGLAAVTTVLAAVIVSLVRDRPATEPADQHGGSLLDLLRMRELWPLMAMAFVAYAPAANLRGLWAGPYLTDIHGFDLAGVGNATLAMAIALIVGTIAYGPLDVVFRTRKWIPVVGSSLNILVLAGLVLLGSGAAGTAVTLLTAITLFGASYTLILAHARSFMPPELLGRGITLMNFFSIGGAGTTQFLSGGVFALAGAKTSSGTAYAAVFAFYALLLAAGLLAYLFSRDRPPESDGLPTSGRR